MHEDTTCNVSLKKWTRGRRRRQQEAERSKKTQACSTRRRHRQKEKKKRKEIKLSKEGPEERMSEERGHAPSGLSVVKVDSRC